MGEEKVCVIQSIWNNLHGKEEAVVSRFYQHLFAEHPEYRPLFTHGESVQRVKFVSMLNIIVNGLDDLELLSAPLKILGEKHRGMSLVKVDYENVATALVRAIDDESDKVMSDIEKQSWFDGFMLISDIMLKAGGDA